MYLRNTRSRNACQGKCEFTCENSNIHVKTMMGQILSYTVFDTLLVSTQL